MEKMGFREARENWRDVLTRVQTGELITLVYYKTPITVLLPPQVWQQICDLHKRVTSNDLTIKLQEISTREIRGNFLLLHDKANANEFLEITTHKRTSAIAVPAQWYDTMSKLLETVKQLSPNE